MIVRNPDRLPTHPKLGAARGDITDVARAVLACATHLTLSTGQAEARAA